MEELTSLAELRDVRIYEASARRRDGFSLEEVPIDPNSSDLKISQDVSDDELIFRCRIEMNTKTALLAADVAARFRLAEAVEEPSKEILDKFSREEGLPVVMPYLRVVIQQVARQVGVGAPLLKHYWHRDLEKMRANTTEESAAAELPAVTDADQVSQ
jgi:transposase-like protein